MINKPKYKVNEIAKDLKIAAKDVIGVLEKYCGVTKKSMAALNEDELNVVFDYFTQNNSVESFDNYFADVNNTSPPPKRRIRL